MPRRKQQYTTPSYAEIFNNLRSSYEEEARRYNQELDQEISGTGRSRTANKPTRQKQQSAVKKQDVKEQQTKKEEAYHSYSTPRPQQNYDGGAFSDNIIPSILDPGYNDWVQRQQNRINKGSQGNNFVQNINQRINPTAAYTNATVGLRQSLAKQQSIKPQESVEQRLSRRILQNNLSGLIDKSKALTNKEIKEINDYRMITDPAYAQQKFKLLNEYAKQADVQGEQQSRPDNYYNENSAYTNFNDPSAGATNLAILLKSAWAKSFASDFIEKTNESQAEVSAGKITRADEFLNMANTANTWVELSQRYANNLLLLQKFTSNDPRERGNKTNNYQAIAKILEDNAKLRQALSDKNLKESVLNLSTWEPNSWYGWLAQKVDGLIDNDLGGIRGNLSGLGESIDAVNKYMNSRTHDEKWHENITNSLNGLRNTLNKFTKHATDRQKGWKKDYLDDINDLNDWRTGNNWLSAHTNVDGYYKAQQQALQQAQYTWKDPLKMAMYGWSGIAGGSNSSWYKSLISMGANIAGYVAGGAPLKAIRIGGTLAATGTAFEANKSAGSDENNIEAANLVRENLISTIKAKDKYEQFIEEGKKRLQNNSDFKQLLASHKKHGNDDTINQYIEDAFIAGLWHSSDPSITRDHYDAFVGSNNLFYNDQPVNTADAAIDAVMSTVRLAPVKEMVQSSKVIGQLIKSKFADTAAGKAIGKVGVEFAGVKAGMHGVQKKIVESEIAKKIEQGVVKLDGLATSASSKIGNLAGSAIKPIRAKTLGIERNIAQGTARVREFATRIPSTYLKASVAGHTLKNIGTRIVTETISEQMQEGVQGLNAYQSKQRDFPYDEQKNRLMGLRVLDDILTGVEAANIYLHQGDPAYHTDADVVASMNATPLLTLFGPGNVGVMLQARDGFKEMKLVDIIANNIDAAKRGEVAHLQQAYEYAKMYGIDDLQAMNRKFDQYVRVAGLHKKAVEDANAINRLRNGSQVEPLIKPGDYGIPVELIENQRKQFNDVWNLAHDKIAKGIAARAGIRTDTKKYAKFIAMLDFRTKKFLNTMSDLTELDNEIESIFHQPVTYEEDDVDQNNTQYAHLNRAKAISQLAMLYQMQQDYTAAQDKTNKASSILSRIQNNITKITEDLAKRGININSTEEAIEYLNNSTEGDALLQSLEYAKLNPEGEVSSIEEMSMEDIVDGLGQYQRKRFLKEYDALLQKSLLDGYREDPNQQLEAYKQARESDQKLEAILEDDYVNSVRNYEEAINREIKDGDIYVGNDDNWYIAIQKKDQNGNTVYVKHKYNPNDRKVDEQEQMFDLMEYHNSKKAEEQALLERQKRQQVNENLANTSKSETTPASTTQQDTVQTQQEERGIKQDEAPQRTYKSGDNVLIKDGDSVIPGTVLAYDPLREGVQVLDSNGLYRVVPEYQLSGADPFDGKPKFANGQQVTVNGKTYTVRNNQLDSVNDDDFTAKYSYDIFGENGEELHVDESVISEYVAPTQQQQNQKVDQENINKKPIPNEKQQNVIDQLRQKHEDDKSIVKHDENGKKVTTGHNYFIKIKNKFIQFIRVHGILDDIFTEKPSDQAARVQLLNKLVDLQNNSIQELKAYIEELQTQTNEDLSVYLTQQALKDTDTPIAISSIVTREKPGVAVEAGSIIDEIARIFFAGGEVINKPEYRMTDATFNSLIKQLNQIQQYFNKLGCIVDTTPYTWYCQLPNGTRIAGETDMIAIDRDGKIHIIDFKTTRYRTRFDQIKQYKTVNPLTGEESWVTIPMSQEAPNGEETRITSNFVDQIAPSQDGRGKRSYAAQYAMQLEAYRQMIQRQTGIDVVSLQVIPIQLDYHDNGTEIQSIDSTHVYDTVNLTAIHSLQKYITDVDNQLLTDTTVSQEDVTSTSDYLQEVAARIRTLLQQENKLSNDTISEITKILGKIDSLYKKIQEIIKDPSKLSDLVYVKSLLEEASRYDSSYNSLSKLVIDDIDAYNENQSDVEAQENDEAEEEVDENWEDGPLEIVTESEQQYWWQFNNLHSMSKVVANLPHYMESIVKRDFIKNSIFKISRDDLGIFHVTIEYRPAGQKAIKFSKDITIRLGNNATNPADRNLDWVIGQESVMARNLIRQFKQLFESLKPGEYIIAKNVKRTNGKLQYSLSPNGTNLMDTPFFDKSNPNWNGMLNGEDSLVGVVDEYGSVVEITSGDRTPIMYPSQDKDGNLRQKNYDPKPGNQPAEGIPAGSVVYLYKFKNEEDDVNDEQRVVPILLKGRKLSDKDIDLIMFVIQNYSKWNEPIPLRVTHKDGTATTDTISGFTYQKAMKLLVRFGDQAIFAGDEFVFGYAMDEDLNHTSGHKMVTVTDMVAQPTEVVDEETGQIKLKRPIITLDLQKEGDVQHLKDILKTLDVHINQMGVMRTNLNSDEESSMVGALGAYFKQDSNSDVVSVAANSTLQFDAEDVLSNKDDVNEGLPIIAWQIKHGIATTNAQSLENPLISITELEKTSDEKVAAQHKEEKSIQEAETVGATEGQPDGQDTIQEQDTTEVVQEEENPVDTSSKIKEISDEDILKALGQYDDEIPEGFGINRTVEKVPAKPISEKRKAEIKKRIKKLIGNFKVTFTDAAIMTLKYGANIAGRLAEDAIVLNENLPEGTEYHEAFHRILEMLVPNSIRISIYNEYRKKYGSNYRKTNGYDLTERDISEGLAEMFRDFESSRDHVRLHWNILRTFNEIEQYVRAINELGDRKFAMLFIAANSGIFRFFRPNAAGVEHFNTALGGFANMKISGVVGSDVKTIDLETFPSFGGRIVYEDAISGLVYSLIRGYNIDDIANNAARISTKRIDVTNNLFRRNETTEHSTWFRILTGEYANPGEKVTIQDAIMYRNIYKNTEEIRELAIATIKENVGKKPEELQAAVLRKIMELMAQQTPETINQNQKMMAELLSEKAWPIVEKAISSRLKKLSIDSQKKYERDDEIDEQTDDENLIFQDAESHKDVFYDHDRSEDASAAVRFLLSTIPDEHFATQDDVDAGIVKSTTDKDGNPIMVSNSTNTLGYRQFLSMNVVSNKLLLACHNVSSAEELDQKLQQLASTDPVFYRLSKKYHAYLVDSIVKTDDGKNAITINGKPVAQSKYAQHYDEDGVYYTKVEDGVDTNERLINAETTVNTAKEAFVTQLFNYVSCQKLDFIQTVLEQVVDESGNEVEGKYKARVQSTDSDYAATIIPREWFIKLRSGVSGIFHVVDEGRLTVSKEGQQLLVSSIDTLYAILNHYVRGNQLQLNGKTLNKQNEADFRYIEQCFIQALNNLGIDITKEQLEFKLNDYYKLDQTKQSISIAFGRMITSAKQDLSFKAYLDVLDRMKKGVSTTGTNEIMTDSKQEERIGNKGSVKIVHATGINMYSDNAFVKWLAQGVSRYNKQQKQLMTNGPGNTKQYTMAQAHTASDFTDDLNKAEVTDDGKVVGSRILKDLIKYTYNLSQRIVRSSAGDYAQTIGSIIIKHLMTAGHSKLRLKINSGVRVQDDYSGGVSYKEITEREDYLGKATILQHGGIIFPTLSDKSTWFHLDGVQVPGLNYKALSSMSASSLLHLGIHTGQNLDSGEAHVLFDFSKPNAQLDQLIEYAFCERNQIEKEINRKHVLNIKFWKDNRKRFAGLTELIILKENGITELVLLNDYDKTPEECLQLADQLFFGKDITDTQRRKMLAMTLEQGLMKNLAFLESNGLIVAKNGLRDSLLDDNGNATGKTRQSNRLFQYSNVGLDAKVIDTLRSIYLSELNLKGNPTAEQVAKAESQAIIQYVWDIYLRGIISNEEVERIYTGAPSFFKWKNQKVKDSLSNKVMNVLTDRHVDQSKRLGGLGSTGEKNRIGLPDIRRTYKCAEIQDQMVVSKLINELRQAFIDNEVRQTYLDFKEEQLRKEGTFTEEALDKLNDSIYEERITLEDIKKELDQDHPGLYEIAVAVGEKKANSYGANEKGEGKINVADGAAYITPKMTKNLLRQRGAYTTKVKEAFEYLEGKKINGKYVNTFRDKQAYKIVMDALFGAQKYSAYGYRIDPAMPDVPIHYYDKFALFPLFENAATGVTQKVLQKMKEYEKETGHSIDMLMMESAVKTGSQDAVEVTDESINGSNFKFVTYDQEYAFIRRQLNTDPHERESMSMGTQMTKIALTNLHPNRKYTLHDGTKVRGRDLLNNIMESINALSDIGAEEIRKEMYTNGEFDINKFAAFLRKELESRNADENLIDGIEIVDGQLKLPLEAMSSVDWIQSILVSKINKAVIDVNVKGNAFYQRSVWGTEGQPTVLYADNPMFKTQTLNNGEDLLVVNEDGSMDSIISIDFFYDIIPSSIRYDFEKARQWLIDNKIIGKDATANTIASRIPTQAQSSIHALRFVDVIPVYRDTIILPKEFTAITGSDFDIDKLYLARLNYNVVSRKDESGKIHDIVTTEFDKDTRRKDYHRNNLINGYLTLLKDHGKYDKASGFQIGNTINISLRSIDEDTDLIKSVLNRIEQDKQTERYYAYKFGNIAFQVQTKLAFMVGKFGIGPFALNNNNQILTQLYGVKFSSKDGGILTAIGATDLSNPKDKQGKMKLSWLSGLINIHVDAAKDPIADKLNINKFTYNIVNLLIRGGMGDRTLLFTSQPIMKELSMVYDNASGSFMVDQTKSASSRQRYAINTYLREQFGRNAQGTKDSKFITQMMNNEDDQVEMILASYAKEIFGVDDKGNLKGTFKYIDPTTGSIVERKGSILEDILTNKEALISTKEPVSLDNMSYKLSLYRVTVRNEDGQFVDVDMTPKQVQLYVAFIYNQLAQYGQRLSDLVNVCKIDTKKQGKNYVEQQAFLQKYETVFANKDGVFEDYGLFKLRGKDRGSYIETKTNNAISLYSDILQNISLQATDYFKAIHEHILTKLNSSAQNQDLSRKVKNAIMTYIKILFFDNQVIPDMKMERENENYANDLFYGDNTVQDNLIRLQNMLKRDKKGEFKMYAKGGIITNPLLRALQSDFYEDRDGYNNPKFIKLENSLLDDSESSNAIERAWDDLYRDKEHYIQINDRKITFSQFAIDLAIYAFYTSGDNQGQTKFFKYVPNSIRQALRYDEYIRSVITDFQNLTPSSDSKEQIANAVIENNWQDDDFVKPIRLTRRYGKNNVALVHVGGTVENKTSKVIRTSKGKFISKSIVTKINTVIAAYRNTGDGIISTIHTGNDGSFPMFIKVRRPGIDRFASDRIVLYRLNGVRFATSGSETISYPVYRIVTPQTVRLRAGSYNYDMIRPEGTVANAYPQFLIDTIEKIFENDAIVTETDLNQEQLLERFVKELEQQAVVFDKEELIELLRYEFDTHQITMNNSMMNEAIAKITQSNSSIIKQAQQNTQQKETSNATKTAPTQTAANEQPKVDTSKLSNTYNRPFEINGIRFQSVYQANAYFRLDFANASREEINQAKQDIVQSSDYNSIKAIMKRFEYRQGEDVNKQFTEIVYNNMYQSFKQNKGAMLDLLSTGLEPINVSTPGINTILMAVRDTLNREHDQEKQNEEFDPRVPFKWARTAENGYEVSTRGDKRFSALIATFKEGTIIDGVDVGGMTIENVYQSVIKKSRKGQAPAKDSKLSLIPSKKGKMSFSYGTNKRNDVKSSTTIEAIRKSERTATTRYSSDGHINYWQDLKEGDIVEFEGGNNEKVLVRITKPLTKLSDTTSAEEWSKKEGWSVDYFNINVKPKLNEAYQMEYEYISDSTKESIEDYSYYRGYLPLWQEWARQNPELINELRIKAKGRTLTDQFANTRVSQARALAEILNSQSGKADLLFDDSDFSDESMNHCKTD